MTNQYDTFRDAIRTIDTLTAPCDNDDPIRDDHSHDLFNRALRDLLIDRDATHTDDYDPSPAHYDLMRELLAAIDAYPYSRDELTRLLLDNSLCPLHAIDYAICFDDDDPACAAIRTIHPSHDT
jgi:hypothetical protein